MKQYTVKVFNNKTEWYNSNNKLDRDDGPAVEYVDGMKCWYKNGKLHRDDGPAYVHSNGYKSWWKNGLLHRENGPAIECANGEKSYYLEDIEYSKEEYYNKINSYNNKIIEVDGKKYTLVPVMD